jgi:hypothetical protein
MEDCVREQCERKGLRQSTFSRVGEPQPLSGRPASACSHRRSTVIAWEVNGRRVARTNFSPARIHLRLQIVLKSPEIKRQCQRATSERASHHARESENLSDPDRDP